MIKQIAVAVQLCFLSSVCLAQTLTAEEMDVRAKASYARNSSYEMSTVKTFWGNASFLFECSHGGKPTPEPFVIYFEVLPNGNLGQILFDPMTDVARCVQSHIVERHFPKPPHGAYVSKIKMSFEQ